MSFITTIQDRVAVIALNKPERLNALTRDDFANLGQELARLGDNDDCDAIILTGNGRAFCTGFSLDSTMEKLGTDGVPGLAPHHMEDVFDNSVNPMIRSVINNPKPVVTAINGMAAGGGVGIALCADVVIASTTAKFQLTFVPKLGILPDAGASWLIARMAGRNRALPAILLGDAISAEQAMDWGMVWKLEAPDRLTSVAMETAKRLAAGPAGVYPTIRAATEQAFRQDLSDHLDLERNVNIDRCASADFAEGIHAFLDKRTPRFSGL